MSLFTTRIAHPETGALERVLASQHGKKLLERYYAAPGGNFDIFTMFSQKNWAVVLPVTKRGEVITVSQFRHGVGKHVTELPAGTGASAKEETPEETMRRELFEETGYAATEVIGFQPYAIASQSSPTCFYPFLALDCEFMGEPRQSEKEFIVRDVISLELWFKMIWGVNFMSFNYAAEIDPPGTPSWTRLEECSAAVATFMAVPELLRRGLITGEFLASIRPEPDNCNKQ